MRYTFNWAICVENTISRICYKCGRLVPWNFILREYCKYYCYSCYSGKMDFIIVNYPPFLVFDTSDKNRFNINNSWYLFNTDIDKIVDNNEIYMIMKEIWLEFKVSKPILSPKYYDIEFEFL